MRRSMMIAMVSLCVLVLSAPAAAQQGRGPREGRMPQMQRLDPDKARTAWTWQARALAREMQLGADATSRLETAYVASREKLDQMLREARQGDGGARPRPGRMDPERLAEHRAALEAQLTAFLAPDQAQAATRRLGAGNAQWDRMVDAVLGFGLGEEKTYAALEPVGNYVDQLAGARELGDWQAMRGLMAEARDGLYDGLAEVLDEQQLAQFQDSVGRRNMRQRQERAERPQRQDRPEGPGRSVRHDASAAAAIGAPAPAFTAADSTGRTHSLADYKGKIVVLQWINPDCPVCRRVSSSGRVVAMREQLQSITDNVVHLTVNSTNYMEPSVGEAYLKTYKIDAPVLIDRDGTVGHLYGAKRTPHLFVIDAEGILRYQGAIDDDERGDKGDKATNYVVQAVRQIVAGETVAPDVTRAYGCTVKYARKPSSK